MIVEDGLRYIESLENHIPIPRDRRESHLATDDLHHNDVRRADAVYTAAYLRLEAVVPGFTIEQVGDLKHITYGRPKMGVWHELEAGDAAPAEVLAVIAEHPDLRDAYVAFHTSDEGPEAQFRDAGYTRIVRNYLMRLDVRDSAGRPDDQIVRLTTEAEIERLAMLREDGRILPEYVNDPEIGCYALVVDDVPVASAVVITDGDTAVVEYVQTLERYRRLGYGRWFMRGLHRLAANNGAHWMVLASNDQGLPLYESLGYQPLRYIDIYHRQEIPGT